MPLTATSTSPFLSLPQELRDIIYTSLLTETRSPPRDPDHAGPRLRINSRKLFFEPGSPKQTLLQLKLVSKQIHDEVQDVLLKHDATSDETANLDLMISGSCIWPTFTKLPVTAHLFPIVQVDVRWYCPAHEDG